MSRPYRLLGLALCVAGAIFAPVAYFIIGSEPLTAVGLSAIMIGFGRAISEVGAVIIVGGNIKGHTQVLTTAIVIQTQKGNFDFALLLGAILLAIALTTAIILTILQGKFNGRTLGRLLTKFKNGGG